ncbi:MAG: hypothetical protein A4S09_16575 [Proteobacteria bacterium SG_bin7]|nr:MAG: hypothetical protein A4S09_16575 [Proteobacteria bacterium SG_bin7]
MKNDCNKLKKTLEKDRFLAAKFCHLSRSWTKSKIVPSVCMPLEWHMKCSIDRYTEIEREIQIMILGFFGRNGKMNRNIINRIVEDNDTRIEVGPRVGRNENLSSLFGTDIIFDSQVLTVLRDYSVFFSQVT